VSEPHDPSPTSASPFAVRDLLADDMQDMQLRLLAGAAPIPGLVVACETHGMPPLSSRLASAMPAERPGLEDRTGEVLAGRIQPAPGRAA